MILLLALPSFAADVPWECPTFVDPVDAHAYRDTDLGLAEVYATLEGVYTSLPTEACAWTETTTVEDSTTTSVRTCALDGVTWTVTTVQRSIWDGSLDERRTTRAVEAPSGETWTRLALTEVASTSRWSDNTTHDATFEASWAGAVLDGLPADGAFGVSASTSSSSHWWGHGVSIDTAGCALAWSEGGDHELTEERVRANERVVTVTNARVDACDTFLVTAEVDGVPFGAVAEDTWSRDPADADADGFPVPCDCDDADPAVNVGAREIAGDGIDQDCDGVDLVEDDIVDEPDTAEPHPDTGEPARDTGDAALRPSADNDGCRSAAAFLVFLPLFGLRRRR